MHLAPGVGRVIACEMTADIGQAEGDGEHQTLSRVPRHIRLNGLALGIDQTIERLFPYVGRRAAVLGFLGNRVTWGAVKHWRAGRHAPPYWALELFSEALETRASELLKVASELKKKPGG